MIAFNGSDRCADSTIRLREHPDEIVRRFGQVVTLVADDAHFDAVSEDVLVAHLTERAGWRERDRARRGQFAPVAGDADPEQVPFVYSRYRVRWRLDRAERARRAWSPRRRRRRWPDFATSSDVGARGKVCRCALTWSNPERSDTGLAT